MYGKDATIRGGKAVSPVVKGLAGSAMAAPVFYADERARVKYFYSIIVKNLINGTDKENGKKTI